MKKGIAAVVTAGLALVLLMACAQQKRLTSTPTGTSPLVDTPAPTHTPRPTRSPGSGPSQPVPARTSEVWNPVALGEAFTYTLTVTNYGPSSATAVVVTDSLPAGVELVSATLSRGTGCRIDSGELNGSAGRVSPSPRIACALGNLPPRATATITVVITPISVTGTLTHAALVAAQEADPRTTNNLLMDETEIEPAADLTLQAQALSPVVMGGTALYTLTVANHGPYPATGVVVTDDLPPGLTLNWSRPSQIMCAQRDHAAGCHLGDVGGGDTVTVRVDLSTIGEGDREENPLLHGVTVEPLPSTCYATQAGDALICHLGDLEVGGAAQVQFAATIGSPVSKTMINRATVGANERDPLLSDNAVTTTATVQTAPPLSETVSPMGPNLTMRVDAPERITAGQRFTCSFAITNLGSMPATDVTFSDTLPAGVTVHKLIPGTPVCSPSDGAITCHLDDPHSAEPITLTLVVTSAAEMPPVVALDPVTPGWPSCNLTQVGDLARGIHCQLGHLQSGGSTQVTVVATAGGTVTRTITNTATIQAYETDIDPSDNRVDTVRVVGVEADLSITDP